MMAATAKLPCFICRSTPEHIYHYVPCEHCGAVYPLCVGCMGVRASLTEEPLCPTRLRELVEDILCCDHCGPRFLAPIEENEAADWYYAALVFLRAELQGAEPAPHDHLY